MFKLKLLKSSGAYGCVCVCVKELERRRAKKKTKDETACSVGALSLEDCLTRIRGSSNAPIPGNYSMLLSTVPPTRVSHLRGNPAALRKQLHVGTSRSVESWSKCGLERGMRCSNASQHLPPPTALIHPLLSARKTRIKRRKVNMEKIQGWEGTLGEETHYCRNLCRIFFFLRQLWRMQTRGLLYKVKSPYWSGD